MFSFRLQFKRMLLRGKGSGSRSSAEWEGSTVASCFGSRMWHTTASAVHVLPVETWGNPQDGKFIFVIFRIVGTNSQIWEPIFFRYLRVQQSLANEILVVLAGIEVFCGLHKLPAREFPTSFRPGNRNDLSLFAKHSLIGTYRIRI